MLVLMMVMLVLATIYGFLLGLYLFLSRKTLSTPLRWIGGISGGIILGGLMAFLALLILWPPISFLLIAGAVGFVALFSGVILFGIKEPGLKEMIELEWEVNNDEVDESVADFNASHGT